MKIVVLGTGAWGTALASVLCDADHEVTVWGRDELKIQELDSLRVHPKLKNSTVSKKIHFEKDFEKAVTGKDLIVESVSSRGLRSVLANLKKYWTEGVPVVVTSKGIEMESGLLFTEIASQFIPQKWVGCISGPSLADGVMRKLPTTVVASGYELNTITMICKAFNNAYFRVYPNSDVLGVSLGGALKNIIAIACGISDGLSYGDNTKAALMTRGLHEIRKMGIKKGCFEATLNGLSGMGDLCVTCLSNLSRNYQFGYFLAQGLSYTEAYEKVGMVVEGAYTVKAARQLAKKYDCPMPITEVVYQIIYEGLEAPSAVKQLLQRTIKDEHL
ncbi:MAG TPA: NAD(P)H-dependent glycerol-3-phosphate dehydrogenase [Chlamydiales bacterium]|nr:NAD(P)H-dependent glycerol-3-phosphate dehydrogenase [Chlamydiales bacterium]